MSRPQPARIRRILVIGAIGLLLLSAIWFDSTRNATYAGASGKPPLPNWGFTCFIRGGIVSVWGGSDHTEPDPFGNENSYYARKPSQGGQFGFKSSPHFAYHNAGNRFRLTLPCWFLLLLYLVIWMGVIAWPRVIHYLKERRPVF